LYHERAVVFQQQVPLFCVVPFTRQYMVQSEHVQPLE
jgi:hypothetical protein